MKTKIRILITLLLVMIVQFSFAQDHVVSGVVSDSMGPVADISVTVKGTNKGTVTDFDGKYSIKAKKGDVLVFSHISYDTVEKTVGDSPVINVTLKEGNTLDEVVVTAYGLKSNTKKITYASQNISQEDLAIAPNTNIKSALEGKISGVKIDGQAGSKLGKTGKVFLRGALNPAGGKEEALYVVDGVKVRDPNNIDMDNVASINVLKGPNATALYGVEGSSGVIVITTKRGKRNNLTVGVNSSITIDNVAYLPKYQNEYGQGYGGESAFDTFTYDASVNPSYFAALDGVTFNKATNVDESWGPKFDGRDYAPWYAWFPDSPYYGQTAKWVAQPNNVKDFYNQGVLYKNNVTVSGGRDNYSGLLSYNKHQQKGLIPDSDLSKDIVTARFDMDLTDKFTINATASFSNQKVNGAFDDGYGNQTSGSFNSWFARDLDVNIERELVDLQTPEGYTTTWNWWNPVKYSNDVAHKKPVFWFNHYYWTKKYKEQRLTKSVLASIKTSYALNDNIKLNLSVANDYQNYSYEFKQPFALEYNSATSLYLNYVNSFGLYKDNTNYSEIRPDITFNYDLTEKLVYNGTLGMSFENYAFTSSDRRMTTTGDPAGGDEVGLVIPDVYNFGNSRENVVPKESAQHYKTQKVFSRSTFTYDNYLTLNADLSWDYDSRYDIIGADNPNRFIYGSLGATLIFTELMNNKPDFLDQGKFYGSYAKVGSSIEPNKLNPTYSIDGSYNGQPALFNPNNTVDPNVKPATSTSVEFGLNLNMLKRRLNLDITYYNEDREDAIVTVPLPSSSGYAGLVTNSGLANRKGIELTLSGTPVKTDNFAWDVTFNFAKNKTMVLELPVDAVQISGTGAFGFARVNNVKGEEWGQLQGTGFKRDDNGNTILDPSTGLYVTESNQNFGSVLPEFNGGFINSFTYKGFNLTANISYQKGGKFFSLSEMWGTYSGLLEETAGVNDLGNPKRDAVADGGGVHVTGVDDTGSAVDMYVETTDYFEQWYSNRLAEPFIHNADYVKLSDLRLSYTFPKKMISKFMQSATFSVVARNLWLISVAKDNIHGWDPSEMSKIYGENGQLPGVKSYGFNVKLTF